MESVEVWLTPLLLLPGVALLIMSTSVRYVRVHEEVHHLLDHEMENLNERANRLYKRSRLFRNALIALYSSVGLLSLAGLLGGVLEYSNIEGYYWIAGVTGLGIIFLFFASLELIRESTLSLDIIKDHIESVDKDGDMELHG